MTARVFLPNALMTAVRGGGRARALVTVSPRRIDALVAAAIGLFVFALYNATLTPSLSYISPDGNELATIPYTLGLAHPTGYPLYTWLGKLFTFIPAGDVAHRVNLMSAAGAAAACSLLYAIVRELGAARLAAAFAALTLGLSTTLWSQATIAEVYAPNLFFVALETYLLLLWARHQDAAGVRRHGDLRSTLLFSGWAFTFALSAGMHLSGLGFAPAFVVFILLSNWRVVAQPLVAVPAAVLFVLGLLQFLWLPVRTVMGEPSPDPINPSTLEGFLNYTVNAFPQFKWAFPLADLPDRFMVYALLVKANFGWWGIGLGLGGAAALAFLRPRAFLLFAFMWAAHLVFFMEYRAQDLDVFYIPAHFVFAVAIGFGLAAILQAAQRLAGRPRAAAIIRGAACVAVAVPLGSLLVTNYGRNDQSSHTEINDFYQNVYATLPRDAVLLGSGGVFGYDMFYYQFVYNLRPDVTLPSAGARGAGLDPARLRERPLYSVDGQGPGPGGAGVGAVPGAWSVPVLVAPAHTGATSFIRRNLVLYRVSSAAPALIDDTSRPGTPLSAVSGGVNLIGADVSSTTVEQGGMVHVRLYWKVEGPAAGPVTLRVGAWDAPSASHAVGFGLLERYNREVEPVAGHTVVEEFDFVVLSSSPAGAQPLSVSFGGADLVIATLEVE